MSTLEVANLEHAGRSALAWVPDKYEGHADYSVLAAALAAAVGILVAATLLLSIL